MVCQCSNDRWWISLIRTPSQFIFLLHTALLWALHLVRVCAHFGRCSRSRLLLSLWELLQPTLLPRLRRSVHCARAHALLVVRKGPWSFCDRGEMFQSVVTGAPPGSLSARCVVFTVSPCLIIYPFFPIDRPLQPGLVTLIDQRVAQWSSVTQVGQ